MNLSRWPGITAALLLVGSARADDAPVVESPEVVYCAGAYLEEVVGDREAALAAYRRAAADRRLGDDLRLAARRRAARCLELLGRDAEALEAYRALAATPGLDPADRGAVRASLDALEARLRAEPEPRSALDTALDRLGSPDPEVRYAAIEELQGLTAETVVPAVVARLTDENPRVRHYAVLLLGQLGERSAGPALRARLEDPIADIRLNAALALHKLGDDSGRATLLAELADGTPATRLLAASHLAHMGSAAGAAVLVDGLEAADGYARQAALAALVRLSGGERFGFEAEGSPEDRAAAIARWRGWLTQR